MGLVRPLVPLETGVVGFVGVLLTVVLAGVLLGVGGALVGSADEFLTMGCVGTLAMSEEVLVAVAVVGEGGLGMGVTGEEGLRMGDTGDLETGEGGLVTGDTLAMGGDGDLTMGVALVAAAMALLMGGVGEGVLLILTAVVLPFCASLLGGGLLLTVLGEAGWLDGLGVVAVVTGGGGLVMVVGLGCR